MASEAEIAAAINEYILTGGRRTRAAMLRTVLDLMNESYVNQDSASTPSLAEVLAEANTTENRLINLTLNALIAAAAGNIEYNGSLYFSKILNNRVGIGGIIMQAYSDVGNTGLAETDLQSYSMPAGMLQNDGESLDLQYCGTFTASATATKQVRLYFGGNVIYDSTALTINPGESWTIHAVITRVTVNSVRFSVRFQHGAVVATSNADQVSLNLNAINIIKITGAAAGAGAGSNNIVATMALGKWFPKFE